MRAGFWTLGCVTLALCATPLACGAPFTASESSATTGSGGGSTSSTASSSGGAAGAGGGGGGTGGQSTTTSGSAGGGTGGAKPECVSPLECPGVDTECRTRSCNGGVCGFVTPKAPTASQIWGDCKMRKCDGEGNLVIEGDSADVYDDANECTLDWCKGTEARNDPKPSIVCGNMGICNDSGACVQCLDDSTCPALKHNCDAGRCVPLHCVDNILDLDETAVDCGGPDCQRCEDGKACGAGIDCQSLVCQGQPKVCKAPSCSDGVKNGSETDTDCGGKCASQGLRCDPNQKCTSPEDCTSSVCKLSVCQPPTCTDGVKNGSELGVDCGGSCSACLPPN
jgi:hypothetical protein